MKLKHHIALLSFAIIQVFLCSYTSAAPIKVFWCSDGNFVPSVVSSLKSSSTNGTSLQTIRSSNNFTFTRGCTFNNTEDSILFFEGTTMYQTSPTNTDEVNILTSPGTADGIAIDEPNRDVYWTDTDNYTIRATNLDNPGSNATILSGAPLSGPVDVELDLTNGKVYTVNFDDGKVIRVNLDGTNTQTLLTEGGNLWGVAVAPAINKIFFTRIDGSIIRADLDGSNRVDLTATIGSVSNPRDIDYDAATNKIWWVQFSSDNAVGRIRRANTDGTNAENMITSGVINGAFLTLQTDTVTNPLVLSSPASSSTHVTNIPLQYSLGETPLNGSVQAIFMIGGSPVGQLTMVNSTSVNTTIPAFSSPTGNADVVSASGFPLTEGTYSISLSYQDIHGNTAASQTNTNVTILLPTPTPTVTPTITPTATPVMTAIPTVTPTSTPSGCTSSVSLPKVKITNQSAAVTVSVKKGASYTVKAKSGASSIRKTYSTKFTASKKGKKTVTFGKLKAGTWNFSYTVKIKKVTTASCAVDKIVKKKTKKS